MAGAAQKGNTQTMSVRANDTYRISCMTGMSSDRLSGFMMLYQPLVGGDGILVYLTMMAESRHTTALEHRRLFTLMQNISADTFERARMRLEAYMLVRTFRKQGKNHDSYVYMLNQPMGPQEFFASSYMCRMYTEAVGEKQAVLTKGLLCESAVPVDQYQEITVQTRNIVDDDFDNETEYITVTPRYSFSGSDDETIRFDYETFLVNTSSLVFPPELRTQETMYQIGHNATLYGISPKRMSILVCHCVNLEQMSFDGRRFDILCRKEKPEKIKDQGDPYDMSPVSFLMNRQNGTTLSQSDRMVIDTLGKDMNFPNEVINVLLEYVLAKCDNRLNVNYIGKMAGTWARKGIDTKQKALDELARADQKPPQRSSPANGNRREVAMPQYWHSRKQGDMETVSDEKLKILQQMQKEMEK